MRENLRDWLPAEAVERSAVRASVEDVVAQWRAHWVARDGLALSGWALAPPGQAASDAAWRDCGASIATSCTTRAAARLAGLALDAPANPLELTDRDRSLIASLARRMVDDLALRLRRLLGAEGGAPLAPPGERRVLATISDGTDTLLSLSIPLPLVLGLCRKTLPKPPPATRPPARRSDVLRPTPLRLCATLGSATLNLAEVRNLAVGDVLVLDRTLGDAAELALADSVVARGVLTEVDGQVALILQTA